MPSSATPVILGLEGDLTLEKIEAVASGGRQVVLDEAARAHLASFRAAAEAEIAANPDKRVYGLNTGFGSNFRDYVSPENLRRLQRNLILSHCAGAGPLAPAPVVRATMLLRAASLALGRSVVRPIVVQTMIDMVNTGVVPAVPRFGSVSASGDLAPLSHIAAVAIGEGRIVTPAGETMTTADYLRANSSAFRPVELEMKEGLALNNGCQYANAWGALATANMRRLVDTAALATALHVQAMRGMGRPFRADLHQLRPHPGSVTLAGWVFDLLEGYAFRDATTDQKFAYDGQIQDPYNLRCAAQALGPCLDLVSRAESSMVIEARSVTDNPIDLNTDAKQYSVDAITSGGHFHGMPIGVDAYGLLQAAGVMARLSNQRCVRIVDKNRNKGLGPQVRGRAPDATESGMLIAEYTTAGLCNQIWGLAMPSHLMSMSTDSGQEDHVSMAANVAMRAYDASELLARVLAIELAFAAQAEHVHASGGDDIALSARLAPVLKAVARHFPPVEDDRELSWDIERLAERVLAGDIVEAAGYAFARH